MGLTCAFLAGGADFLGGIASKRMNALRVTLTVAITGLAWLALAWLVFGGNGSREAALWGALSGAAGAIGLALLYACLALGPMSVLSPLTALVSAVVPVVAGLAGGERLSSLGYFALCTALLAVVLVGIVPEKSTVRATPKAVAMAVASGSMIGVFLILLALTPADSGFVPLLFNRGAMAVALAIMMGTIALLAWRRARRGIQRTVGAPWGPPVPAGGRGTFSSDYSATPASTAVPPDAGIRADVLRDDNLDEAEQRLTRRFRHLRNPVALAIGAGTLDASAITALLIGMRVGDLTVMSVLNALYPGGTIVLAALLLRERLAGLQIAGLVLALAAAALFAAA